MAEDLKVIEIWTMQLGKWRLAKANNIPILDITAKSGHNQFAPDFSKVMDYKQRLIDEESYTTAYLERIDYIKKKHPSSWDILTTRPKVALACYCKKDVFCHRHLFLVVMEDYLVEKGIAPKYMGELS